MYQTFTNERLPPGPGGALAVQCQKLLGAWDSPRPAAAAVLRPGAMMDVSWRFSGRWFFGEDT